jgi:hypothetical protein
MSNSALDFLTAIFGSKPADHNILVWTLNRSEDSKRNNFFTSIEEAANYATAPKSEGTDVYFCVGTLPKLKKGRGKLTDVLGIGSIHLDVDIQNSLAHKKNNLPATIEEAVEFVTSIPIKPSIIVFSGYGIHAYWLLKNFIEFTDEETRQAAMKLIESWQKMFKWKAGKLGYDLDATQDITRVLRVPSTLNWKIESSPVEATLLAFDDTARYTPGQLNDYLDDVRAANRVTVTAPAMNGSSTPKINATPYNDISIDIDPAATIDNETFEALSDNIPKFKSTWTRTRKDLQDTSASSYDIALANMAVGAGLDDQTVCNLLIAHRRKHNDEKLRLDYLQRTIAEARNGMQAERQKVQAAKRTTDPTDKEGLKRDLFTMLGIKIERIEKHLSDPPAFIIYFEGGKHKNFGDGAGLLDQNLFRRHVFNAISKVVRKMKEPIYEAASQKMADLADEVVVADEATEVGEVRDILETYIDEKMIKNISEKQHRANAAAHAPAVINGKVAINALELWQYAKRRYGYKKEKKDLVNILKRLQADREVFNVKDERDKQKSISVYCLPPEWLPAGAVKERGEEADEIEYAGKYK